MRFESSVTSVSWIPSESVAGLYKTGFAVGASHPDDPPPEVLQDLDGLFAAERFRFANRLAAWIEVEDGRVVDAGYAGRGYISGARFGQTTGGRTGAPMPRPVSGKPFLQWLAPTVWTTLTLTIGADGSAQGKMTGASPFPRHWIYDDQGQLVAKSGLADFSEWMATAHGQHSPWGQEDSQPLITVAESALERQLSTTIMRGGAKPAVRKLAQGMLLAEQGDPGHDIYLLLDG